MYAYIFQTIAGEPILLQMRHVAGPRDLAADYKTVLVRQASVQEQQFAGGYCLVWDDGECSCYL